jgi:hypothetical protein
VTQVGTANYRIDIGVKHPQFKGSFMLAIECDGAMYHSSKVARDRDKIRQSVLEDLGWTFHRIWGTRWYRYNEDEKNKLRDILAEQALRSPLGQFVEKNVFEEMPTDDELITEYGFEDVVPDLVESLTDIEIAEDVISQIVLDGPLEQIVTSESLPEALQATEDEPLHHEYTREIDESPRDDLPADTSIDANTIEDLHGLAVDEIAFMSQFPRLLWLSTGGMAEVFHETNSCKALRRGRALVSHRGHETKEVIQVARREALLKGRRPCEVCFPKFANEDTQLYRTYLRTLVTPPSAEIQTKPDVPTELATSPYEIGSKVRVTSGPFNNLVATVKSVDVEEGTLLGALDIFGRVTEVNLSFHQVEAS